MAKDNTEQEEEVEEEEVVLIFGRRADWGVVQLTELAADNIIEIMSVSNTEHGYGNDLWEHNSTLFYPSSPTTVLFSELFDISEMIGPNSGLDEVVYVQ